MSLRDALALAERYRLDLVEVAPNANPPVCRIMDFGKFKYETEKKEREARRHQAATRVKEIQFHPSVEEHDYQTKLRKLREFILDGHRVKVSLFFRGREHAHHELGYQLLQRVMNDCQDIASPDQIPTPMGRGLVMMLGPRRGLRKASAPGSASGTPSTPQGGANPSERKVSTGSSSLGSHGGGAPTPKNSIPS